MKKNLAKAVVLGLMCASVLPGGKTAEAAGDKTIIINDSSDSNIDGSYSLIYGTNNSGQYINAVSIEGSNNKDYNVNLSITAISNDKFSNALYNNSAGIISLNGEIGIGLAGNNLKYGINNNGKLTINSDISISSSALGSEIVNLGKLNLNGNINLSQSNYPVSKLITNSDNAEINIISNKTLNLNGLPFLGITVIDNSGILNINKTVANGSYTRIVGGIRHNEGAVTNIVLNGYDPQDSLDRVNAEFIGDIYGSDENFKLELQDKAAWYPDKYQTDVVTGIVLQNGAIYLHNNVWQYLQENGGAINQWDSEYMNLNLNNLQVTGSGTIHICTDLINNQGDTINLSGNIPATLAVGILNKDDNDGVPITKDDNCSVTIVTIPKDAALELNAGLLFYNNNKIAVPIIEEAISNNELKEFNFVGWGEGNDRTLEDETKGMNIEPNINIRDIDTPLKRINDIRTDPSEVGVWIRGEKGDTKIRNYKYEYNLMSGGYDWHNENDARKLFYGFGITYSTNDCDDNVIGDTKSLGYNLYGSWLGKKNNDYVDVVLKWGTLDKDYAGLDRNGVFVKGDYDKDLFAIAAQYGRRIFVDDSFYYEPQIGYTYGRVGSADYVDNWDTHIHADASNSHIASLGVQVGKNIKVTEVYGKLAYVYDFDGNIHVSAPGISADDDMGGGYMQVAIGASRKVDKDNSFYIDVEKDFGNKVKKPYAFSIGYRHTF